MKKTNSQGAYFIPAKIASELKTSDDWAFYILEDARKQGISKDNFYKLFIYAEKLPIWYNAPER